MIMLKFETLANVGDVIKAYDFPPMSDRPDSYVKGVVEKKGPIFVEFVDGSKRYVCDGYTIHCLYDTDYSRQGIKIHVPFETSMRDFDNRIEVI